MFNTPRWIKKHLNTYKCVEDIPREHFHAINKKLDRAQSPEPEVSIVIAAWNEEVNVFNCISSLSDLVTRIPFEIIVVNNNSTDNTQATLDHLHVKRLFQAVPGCGPARQLGQEHALGKYVLLADADCLYPPLWLDEMIHVLRKTGVVCVYGRYSFTPQKGYPRWKLSLLEKMKDGIAGLRHLKRPYLNAYGMSMGYIASLGLKVGFVDHKVRGEDGRMCFDLMAFGKIKQVKSAKARVWTSPRTLQLEGSFGSALLNRIKKEIKRFFSMFRPHPPHNTKTSTNE